MNAVEIADAISDLFQKDFDRAEFPFSFLEAFGNKEITIKRLRKGDSNSSDVPGGVLQRNNIHLAVCDQGNVADTLRTLRESPKTASNRVKFILATDGEWLEAEEIVSGEALSTPCADLPSHFAFFFPLAGISTVTEIKENPIDIRATGRLNKLYVELLKENPDWATEARRPDMNHFMARLIFCFFAEDTGIFYGDSLFTGTLNQMTDSDGANTAQVIGRVFEAMNLSIAARNSADLPPWADYFPYVNGGLFSGSLEAPRFTRIARSYLLRAGELNWRQINPDIFGSMIQAVADDEERGALGMHYTSVPNILKVLNPLFLDDLRSQLDAAGDNPRMLLNLRKRMARIRVFDPACGSGNFLVIAYKEMRRIEAEINRRRDEAEIASEIPLTNFRGIEIRDFAAEIARLALIIAEYQCDVLYRGEKLALAEFLPLNKMNWIVCGNALRLDWLQVCPPTGTGVKVAGTDLFSTPLDQAEIDFENEGGETYICGNPPYLGFTWQSSEQKTEIRDLLAGRSASSGFLDYVAGWFIKAVGYGEKTKAVAAFVSTNSICQGLSVPILWPILYQYDCEIRFAYTSFKWSNLASNKAGVSVAIVCIGPSSSALRRLYVHDDETNVFVREGLSITPYLTFGPWIIAENRDKPISDLNLMEFGNKPSDLGQFMARDRTHIVAMTGSYFRGDAEAVLSPSDEARFDTVTYTYYEQLNGYEYLKALDIGYFFYTGKYVDAIIKVLDPTFKTIVHIPNVNSRESLKDKHKEVEVALDSLGDWKGIDPITGFHLIESTDLGRMLKVADLVDDSDPARRSKVLASLKDPANKNNREHVDIIIALGMAKEGFDWIWCEHALTIGYRSSLTEIIQIIGRATRDAPGKERARFTNLIAEPDASENAVVDAINDTLKAIAASLLMEQVLAPRFEFTPKDTGAKEGFNYGTEGYGEGKKNVGYNEATGQVHIEIGGLVAPASEEASRVCREDLNEVITAFIQDKSALEKGLFDMENTVPEELTQVRMGKIVRDRYPDLSEQDQEAIRQHAIAAMAITQKAKEAANSGEGERSNLSLIEGVRKFVMDVRELDIDLIDRINPFDAAYSVLAKAMDEKTLRQVQASISAKRVNIPLDEARDLAVRAVKFKKERGRIPDINSQDAWEKRLAEGAVAFVKYKDAGKYD